MPFLGDTVIKVDLNGRKRSNGTAAGFDSCYSVISQMIESAKEANRIVNYICHHLGNRAFYIDKEKAAEFKSFKKLRNVYVNTWSSKVERLKQGVVVRGTNMHKMDNQGSNKSYAASNWLVCSRDGLLMSVENLN